MTDDQINQMVAEHKQRIAELDDLIASRHAELAEIQREIVIHDRRRNVAVVMAIVLIVVGILFW